MTINTDSIAKAYNLKCQFDQFFKFHFCAFLEGNNVFSNLRGKNVFFFGRISIYKFVLRISTAAIKFACSWTFKR